MARFTELFDQYNVVDQIQGDNSNFTGWTPKHRLPVPPGQNSGWTLSDSVGTNRAMIRSGASISNAAGIAWDEPGDQSDQELLALCNPNSAGFITDMQVILRGSGVEGTFVGGFWSGSGTPHLGIHITQFVNPFDLRITLGTVPFAIADVKEYHWMRFQVIGNDYKLKAWPFGDVEPTPWNLEVTSAGGPSSGWSGIGSHNLMRCARIRMETDPADFPVDAINPYPVIDEGTFFDEYAIGDFVASGMSVDFDQPHQISATRAIIDTLTVPPVPAGGKDRVYHKSNNLVVNRSYLTRWIPDIAQFGSNNENGMGTDMTIVGLVRSDGTLSTENGVAVRANGEIFGREHMVTMLFKAGNFIEYFVERGGDGDIAEDFAYTWTSLEWHWMKLQHIGKDVKGKAWPFDSLDPTGLLLEPAAWLFERTNRWSVDGRFGMPSYSTLVDHYWDRLDFLTAGVPAPPGVPEVPIEIPRGQSGGPCPIDVGECVGAVVDPVFVCETAPACPEPAAPPPIPPGQINFMRHSGANTATSPQVLDNVTIADFVGNPFTGTAPRSVEMWVRSREQAETELVLSTGINVNGRHFDINVALNDDLIYSHWGGADSFFTVSGFWTSRFGVWGQLTYTFDGVTTVRAYWNGVEVGNRTDLAVLNTLPSLISLWSGQPYNGPGVRADLDMFDLRLWSKELTPTEVLTNSGIFLPASTPSLEANFQMQEGVGTPVDIVGAAVAVFENTSGFMSWESEVDPR